MRFLKICFIAGLIMLMPGLVLAEECLIKIDFSEMKLILFDDTGQELLNFPVALPKITPCNFPIEGRIAKIEKDPYWFPTEPTRKAYFKKRKKELPSAIKPGDPLNAMGAAKIIILFKTAGVNKSIRIHGTNDESSIGKRITRGCIRLSNKDILILINHIKNKLTQILFVK